MEERELIQAVLAGDIAAERELYDRHVDRVYRLAHRMSGDAELAQDFTQDAFVRAFDHLPGFRGQAAFSTWLHSITVSVVLNGLRKVKRYRHWEADWEDVEESPGGMGGAEDPDAMLKLKLHRAIDGLPDDLRSVFVMHDVEGYKHREIGEVLEIPEGSSKARLSRAREKLRRAIEKPLTRQARKDLR
jgi:RNA polymerase sigma-70 factor (ECF subfamily)